MATPVNNEGINLKVNVGNVVDVNLKIGGAPKMTAQQGRDIIQSLNQKIEQNPNLARNEQTGNNAGQPPANNQPVEKHGGAEGPNIQNNGEQFNTELPARGAPVARGQNGATTADDLPPGQTRTPPGQAKKQPVITPTQTDLPIDLPQDDPGNSNRKTQNTPPILPPMTNGDPVENMPKPTVNLPYQTGQNPYNPYRNSQQNRENEQNQTIDYSLNNRGNWQNRGNGQENRQNNFLRQVVSQVLRQNDVYLNNGALNKLLNQQTIPNGNANGSQPKISNGNAYGNQQTIPNGNAYGNQQKLVVLPREINNLIQTIGSRALSLLDSSPNLNNKAVELLARKISLEIQAQIQTTKQVILSNADLSAKNFRQLNITERMLLAVELMPRHVPPGIAQKLENYESREILNGLLLARGLVAGQEKTADLRNLIANSTIAFPQKISMTAMRDVGQLVKILISDAAGAKSSANLDLAVQKFVRILLANNELGVLLATIDLAAQPGGRAGLISRSLALAQIYELINRLIAAGEKALKEAVPNAAKTISTGPEKSVLSPAAVSGLPDRDESGLPLAKLQGTGAESALRQFLEFNPAMAFDNSASAFQSRDDARQAQKDFVSLYQNDIDSWLKSGNHRFVKEFDFEKPVGVVVERGSEGLFTASKVRIVLVRDGSVQGWHFLKSFLVK